MNTEKHFAEFSRMLAKADIETGPVRNGCLPIMLNGWPVGWVQADGGMFRRPTDLSTHEATELYHRAAPICEIVAEYLTAIENAPSLHADGLDEDFKLLAEFNGTVLAGRETEKGYGMKFVTWDWSYGKTGLYQGHYHMDQYAAAKEDFAKRAGLVPESRLFTDEQLSEIYSCIRDTLERDVPLTDKQTAILEKAGDQIVSAVPDLTGRIAQEREQVLKMTM